MAPVEIRLGLIGCGTVGSAVAASFTQRRASLEELTGEGRQALVRKCRITTPFLGGKLMVDKAMRASGKFEDLLVPTTRVDSADQLLDERRIAFGAGRQQVSQRRGHRL